MTRHLPLPAGDAVDLATSCAATALDRDRDDPRDVVGRRNASTQTSITTTSRVLHLLVTTASSSSQQAAKLPALEVPEDEAVAITMVASVSSQQTSPLPGLRLVPCATTAVGDAADCPPAELPALPRGVARGDPAAVPALQETHMTQALTNADLQGTLFNGAALTVPEDGPSVPPESGPVELSNELLLKRKRLF